MKRVQHELVPAETVHDKLVDAIDHASDRVHLQTMGLEATGRMERICHALLRAAERGVDMSIAFDRIAYQGVPPWSRRRTEQFAREIRDRGGTIHLLGAATALSSVMGRSHGKAYIIDDTCFYGGGINLTSHSFGYHDYMFQTSDPVVAPGLLRAAEQALPNTPQVDQVFALSSERTLLIDGGMRQTSLILERATAMVHAAKRIWYLSQFSPAPQLGRAMRQSCADALITAKFNTPRSSPRLGERLAVQIDVAATVIPNTYRGTRRIHGKALVVEISDGSLEAISGSHNFSGWGVAFGTKEIALQTTNQSDCKQLVDFIERVA